MNPQVYYETNKLDNNSLTSILEQNSLINKSLIEKTESGEKLTLEDIKESKYLVPKIYKFNKLVKDIYLTIYDIPGLNDNKTKDIYF